MRYFNTILHPYEKSRGGREKESDMANLKNFLENNNLIDLDLTGVDFTWNNMHTKDDLIQTKIEKVVV